jgi:ABC-type dipeptide/oligopeptide/nickel transport system permease component
VSVKVTLPVAPLGVTVAVNVAAVPYVLGLADELMAGSELGLAFAGLLSGAVMTETVFDWPGLGQYLVKAAVNLDYPAIQGGTLLIAFIYVLINLFVDILYGVLDPRVRYE